MAEDQTQVNFTFGWLAMKLLGKSLYSNAWSALSELVANGFDANAKNVYIYIDIRNKDKSTIEIFDNGYGMSSEDMETYAKVGYNKRNDPKSNKTDLEKNLMMGRKGIGKLAALYLSENYYILTKTTNSYDCWEMFYTEKLEEIDEKPYLRKVDNSNVNVACIEEWTKIQTGTLLKLTNVNLSGYGDISFQALEYKLSNYFLLASLNNKAIKLCIRTQDKFEFSEVNKTIAFKNMAFIEYSHYDKTSLNTQYNELEKATLTLPYSPSLPEQSYNHKLELIPFKEDDKNKLRGTYPFVNDNGEVILKPYTLKGWIGIHSSIEKNIATKNDSNFLKNSFYNPIQLRLYIRNKLAIENFLNVINNTQAFVNYIEGEISFDILDDNDLPDIATSNRQGLDEHDQRVELLKTLVSNIIEDLIKKRSTLAKNIDNSRKNIQNDMYTSAKDQFSKEVGIEIDNLGDAITAEEKINLTHMIVNKIKGDITPKDNYLIFFSHSSNDTLFTDFLYHILINQGATQEEFFYTSKGNNTADYRDKERLADRIKKCIIDTNTLLFFLTSETYKESEFCMFEGGAGWATRSVGKYILWSLHYNDIPKFLTNGKSEFTLVSKEGITLDKNCYLFIVDTLNRMIEHLNAGRKRQKRTIIKSFPTVEFPNDVILEEEHKTINDYMDSTIMKYWNIYVTQKLPGYIYK